MTQEDYIAQVLKHLRHVTGGEYTAIRAELSGHLEDRIEALMECGLDETAAESRAVFTMGDPEEVGRELSRQQQSFFWVLLGRAFIWLTAAVVGLCVLLGAGSLWPYQETMAARLDPAGSDRLEDYEEMVPVDIRIRMGDDILHIYEIGVWDIWSRKNVQMRCVTYDRFPGGLVSNYLPYSAHLEDTAGEEIKMTTESHGGSAYADYVQYNFSVDGSEDSVIFCLDRFGESVRQEITLPEVAP